MIYQGSVDWPVVLEFVKALAGPVAAVVVAWTAARLAGRGFRQQKLIERRLDWYESMFRHLRGTAVAFNRAAGSGRKEHLDEAYDALNDVLLLSMTAQLYADQGGLSAVNRWLASMELVPSQGITREVADNMEQACALAMSALALEMRKDLKMRPLRHDEWTVGKLDGAVRLASDESSRDLTDDKLGPA